MGGSPRAGAMRALPRAGSLLLLLLLAVHSLPSRGLKYRIRAVDLKSIGTVLESGFFSRISSWRNSTVGGHPWQVSLKLSGHYFCGGSLIQDDLVVTAVHCLISLNEKQIKSLTVTAGEYNLFQKDKEEQNIPVSKIIIHPKYNRLGYMSFNIALLYLKHKVKFGTTIQPICIPHRGDKFEEGILCMASGWGKISEMGTIVDQLTSPISAASEYSSILQEVEVPIMDDRTCGTMLRGMNLPPLGRDMCASFPDGEKDACQRDSGGPLVCRRDDGAWVLAGIASLAAGCTRGWNPFRNKQRKASPGIFSKVFVLMDFITQTMTDSLNKIGSTSFPKTNPISSAKAIPYGVCGIPPFSPQWLSRRIAGGVEACPHCWPWQVGLRFLGNHQCGGAIINSIWILTAAHCVQSKNNPLFWTIIAGDHDRTLKESTEQVRRAKHIVMHEDFDTLSYDSDIALIQLSSALEFNSVVRPVCLPHSLEPLFSSEICVVTGWGSVSKDGGLASRLQQIQVPVLEREVCERTYYSAHPGGISEKMICAGFATSGGKDVGQNDEVEFVRTGYGKDMVKVLHIQRDGKYHIIKEVATSVQLTLSSKREYLHGDNSDIIPTDTIKNTVHVLAKFKGIKSIETFAMNICEHFLSSFNHVIRVQVYIEEVPWKRFEKNGVKHVHAFIHTPTGTHFCEVEQLRSGPPVIHSGIKDLKVLKTTQSGFEGFLKDQFTTLPEVKDRCFATQVYCKWRYHQGRDVDFEATWYEEVLGLAWCREAVRGIVLEKFAGPYDKGEYSPSVQKTLYDIQVLSLSQLPEIEDMEISLPNIHYFNIDMSKMGLINKEEVLLPSDNPYGRITGTVKRKLTSRL